MSTDSISFEKHEEEIARNIATQRGVQFFKQSDGSFFVPLATNTNVKKLKSPTKKKPKF